MKQMEKNGMMILSKGDEGGKWRNWRNWMKVGLFLSKWMEGTEEEGGNANSLAKCWVGNGGV
jgi:hypothetical protein